MRRILAVSLLSSFCLTAAAATGPSVDVSASTPRAISTGVTCPRLVVSRPITITSDELPKAFSNPARVVLKFDLDETGSPRNIRVAEALTQPVDARVNVGKAKGEERLEKMFERLLPGTVEIVGLFMVGWHFCSVAAG